MKHVVIEATWPVKRESEICVSAEIVCQINWRIGAGVGVYLCMWAGGGSGASSQ